MTGPDNRNAWAARMERALELISARLDNPPALEELAAAAALSPYHFHRVWRVLTGETVGETLARLRIAAAQQRLAAAEEPITDIAMAAGFATPQSFARAFRRVAGMSPTEFLSQGLTEAGVSAPDGDIRIELREGLTLVAMRRDGGAYKDLNDLFWAVWNWAEAEGKLAGLQGLYGLPFDDPESVPQASLRYAACLALEGLPEVPPPFERIVLPAGGYAVLRHDGSYEGLEASNQRLMAAVLLSGREPGEMMLFHHFLDDPEQVAEADLRTDILLLLKDQKP